MLQKYRNKLSKPVTNEQVWLKNHNVIFEIKNSCQLFKKKCNINLIYINILTNVLFSFFELSSNLF